MELAREAAQRRRSCRLTRRNRSTSPMSATAPAPRPFPTAVTSPRSRSIPETGIVEVVKYSCVNDFGTVINPMIVDGQLHGGVVQGIGQALMENTVYDGDGQLLTGSFMDYAMPRAGGRAVLCARRSSGAGEDQPAWRQRLRRSRLRRRADLGDECGHRCAVDARHPPRRHAADAVRNLASAARRESRTRRNDASHFRTARSARPSRG